jgi:hypothetical protein
MFRSTAISVAVALLACTSNALADHHETSTFEEFQDLGKLVVGRWVGDIKFIADWPGQDLGKGDRVVGYTQYDWVADKRALRNTGTAGNVSHTALFAWDPVAKQIKLFSVDTSGNFARLIIWKKSGRVFGWRFAGGGTVDGLAHGGTGELVFSEDGRTMTLQGQTTLGDAKNDPLKDVYKKLSP